MANAPTDELYLFLLLTDIDTSDGHLAVHLPQGNKTYYWSFDPNGTEQLPRDTWEELGLPHIKFRAEVGGRRWTKEVYDCISQFHRTKGFNPTSQEVAIELGYPLVNVDRLNSLIDANEVCLLPYSV